MKRKMAMVATIILILTGLIACGSNSPDSAEQDEAVAVAQELTEPENTEEETETNEESAPEPEEEIEIVEEEEDIPYWYMDSEGIKSEELGIVIKKDVALTDNFTIKAGINMRNESENKAFGCNFSCGYYESDLDSYISENPFSYFPVFYKEIKKGSIGEINYAYGESSAFWGVLIVDNGIVFLAEFPLELGSAEDLISKILKSENESNTNNLAYIMEDGFHIPALGIMIPYEGGARDWDEPISVSGDRDGISMNIWKENDAQGWVDQLLESAVSDGNTAIEETIEISIGKYQYLGRGVIYSDNREAWYFVPDNADCYIGLSPNAQYNGGSCKDYISVIESLE